VTRALEHAAAGVGVRVGAGLADQRIGPGSALRVVNAILSGAHERDTSHYEMLRAFAPDRVLRKADATLEREAFRTHEFGDSVLIEAA
jgi:S-adenosylmethionine:tRNA ribosyltransferase-isomerase